MRRSSTFIGASPTSRARLERRQATTPRWACRASREEAAASLKSLQRRADAVHAAAHPLGHGAPCRRDPRLSRLARLRAAALLLRAKAVRDDVGRAERGGDARRPVPTRIDIPICSSFLRPSRKWRWQLPSRARLLSDAVAVAAKSEVEDRDVAAFRSDAPLRMLVTRRTAHDRVMAVQYILADLGYLARQNFIGNLGTATGAPSGRFKSQRLAGDRRLHRRAGEPSLSRSGQDRAAGGASLRQARLQRVFDLPISFRDPAVSLGTMSSPW